MLKKLSAGDDISSYCTRCKLDLYHIIIAMVGEKVVKVQCKTCGSVHSLRNNGTAKKSSDTRRAEQPKRRSDTVQTLQALWERGIAEANGKEVPYRMESSYRTGDVVEHAVFGKGVVLKTHFKKCEVLFKDKERMLVSSNT